MSLSDLRPAIVKAIANLPSAVRFRAENAIEGIKRAKALFDMDREMASFRAITAEEEAAAALFRSLQLRQYPGSDQLDLHRHTHKAAAAFFIAAVKYTMVADGELKLRLTVYHAKPSVEVALPVRQFASFSDAPENVHIVLEHPLGVVSKREGVAPGDRFDAAVRKVAGDRNVDRLIANAANARNKLLYAHDSGRPESKFTVEGLASRESMVELFIILSIAVLQVEAVQPMASQCLNGFLKVIGRVPPADVYT